MLQVGAAGGNGFVTPQEQQLLVSLTQRINQTQLQEKDPDAENLLGRELGANPDALYILAQTVLVQNIALDQAKAQVAQLQQQVQQASHPQPAHATSFLGRLLGDKDPQPAPQQAPPPPPSYQQGYQPVPQYAPPYTPQPQYGGSPYQAQPQYVPVAGGQPSFLRGAMQTAAGVAAGALAFEGVESVLHGIGGHGGYGWGGPGMGIGGMGMGGGFDRPVEETVINNNYYDDPGGQGGEHRMADSGDGGADAFRDAGDTGRDNSGDDQAGFDDASNDDNSGDDANTGDASGFDDGGSDDGGSFDGGGFDDNSGGDLS